MKRRAALFLAGGFVIAWLAATPALAQAPANAVPLPETRPDVSTGLPGGAPSEVAAEGPARKGAGGSGAPSGPAMPEKKKASAATRDHGTESTAPATGAAATKTRLGVIPTPEPRPDAKPENGSPAASEEDGRAAAERLVPKTAGTGPVSTPFDPLTTQKPVITPAAAVRAAAAVEDAKLCEAELEKRGAVFTVGESISNGECGVLRPVSIERLSSGVAIAPGTKLLCRSALALDRWMTESVVPAAKASFPATRLAGLRHASTYVCRTRASENGISEHARGSAVDIARFVLGDGRSIGVETQAPGSPEARFQRRIRNGACGPFKTVLGPGTDADHATHFHLDIAARRNGSTYCK